MDNGWAWVEDGAGLDLFVRDLALCLSVHRDRSPALVWPDGVDTVLAGMRGVPRQRADAELPGVAAGTADLTTGLGELLGCRVGSRYVTLPTGAEGPATAATDLVVLPVLGGCAGRVDPAPPGRARAALTRALEVRLRVGEALYVPRGFGYTLAGTRSPCTLLVLALHPPSW
ncbi:hypothetical protein [Streptomyces mangrovisoli]|uniref:JmjC domain-containing protein n=1 Tax=Streptomyces mangrovisoli TaxID=1428628 RepID=A0A1J4NKC5_9ACTN|nr:hypothetical protein [Streptomyces mangrovisoli]OIJ62751.1 hypothetical protein WN71_037705 [Streptomyces mangrovisoli]